MVLMFESGLGQTNLRYSLKKHGGHRFDKLKYHPGPDQNYSARWPNPRKQPRVKTQSPLIGPIPDISLLGRTTQMEILPLALPEAASPPHLRMSALPLKTDISEKHRHVR
jgi:hypothetical protein